MAIRESELSTLNTVSTSDYVRSVSDGKSTKAKVTALAKTVIENYRGSNLAGPAQSVKSAFDAVNERLESLDESAETSAEEISSAKDRLSAVEGEADALDARITNLAQLTEGSTTGDAELIDARTVGATTYASLHQAIDTEFTNVKSDLNVFAEDVNEHNLFTGWQQGYYSTRDGNYDPNHSNYVCTKKLIEAETGDLIYIPNRADIVPTTLFFSYYNANKEYISSENVWNFINLATYRRIQVSNVKYVGFSFGFGDTSVNPKSVVMAKIYKNTGVSQADSINLNVEQNNINMINFLNKYYTYGQGYYSEGSTIIGFITPITAKVPIVVTPKDGFRYAVFRFSGTAPSVATEISSTGWITTQHLINKGEIFLINVSKTDGSRIKPSEGYEAISLMSVADKSMYPSYSIDSAFNRNLVTVTKIGTLTYLQSFCIYDGHYYSTDGTHISKQDSSFVEVSNSSIDAGHGNSMQLGNNGKAYISGWDDNKLYVINLDNLTIESTIDLPTTGYTTACVDDVNKIAYIFQRDSYPDTEDYYNFITYDYQNDSVIGNKILPVKFGAMQACDFYNGRIIVANGTGTNGSTPNGLRVYNTIGDCIGEYVLQPPYSTQEIEGIFIDRNTKEIYTSYSSKNLFKLN